MLQFIALHITILHGVFFEGCDRSTGFVGTFLCSTSSVSLFFSHEKHMVACLLSIQMTLNMYYGELNVRACHFVASLHPASFPEGPDNITHWYMYTLQVFSRSETDHIQDVRAFCVVMKPFRRRYGKSKYLDTQGTSVW